MATPDTIRKQTDTIHSRPPVSTWIPIAKLPPGHSGSFVSHDDRDGRNTTGVPAVATKGNGKPTKREYLWK